MQGYSNMKWYYQIRGGHTHVRVFMNGWKCGDLCFRNEEFDQIQQAFWPEGLSPGPRIEFIEEP